LCSSAVENAHQTYPPVSVTIRVERVLLVATVALAHGSAAYGQDPKPDTTRRPAPAPVTLPTIQTTAPRDERVIFEQKPNVGTITITGRELTSAPRFFGEADVLRAVRLLPGVTARNDYSVGMNVRGGEADQNLVLLDGYPIYNPFHMGGLFGAFVEPMVDRVDFMTGGFPAAYGGRLSSVLDVHSALEPRAGMHGRADVSMIATTVALGGGTQQGRGTWTVAARRTYADKVADLYQKGSLPYHFRDAQAHFTRVLPGALRLSFTAYDNVDRMTQSSAETADADQFILTWGNRLFGATVSRSFDNAPRLMGIPLGDSARVEQRLSRSRFDVHMNLFESLLTLNNRVIDDRAAGSIATYTARHARRVGYDLAAQRFSFDANYPLLLYPSDSIVNRNTTAGVYYDDLWRPSRRWILQMGARVDAVTNGGAPVLQPRLSAKYFVNPDLAVTAAVGQFAQSTHSLAREDVPIRALDFWVGSDIGAPMSRAQHYILGVERWLPKSRALRVETFLKQYPNLIEQNNYSDPNIRGDEFLRIHGYSYGADMMLRQFDTGSFGGWLAYSFAISKRVDASGVEFNPGQDRRHDLNLVTNWTGPRYTVSARFNLATGTPYTVVTGQFNRRDYDPTRHVFDFSTMTQFITGPRNAERLPLSQRLDLSVTRNGHIGGTKVTPFLSIMNVYNAKNVFAYVFNYGESPPKRVGLRQFPVFPTLGVSVVW
jgi:hypothetical protein